MRTLWRLALLGLAITVGPLAFSLLYVVFHKPVVPTPKGDIIAVISGPITETSLRTRRGSALFLEGHAPRMIMSGGNDEAIEMSDEAATLGVPRDSIVIENKARSTLQNALFIKDWGVAPDAHVLLVTHRYHLPRAWLSFRWAGFTNVSLIAADAGAPVEVPRHVLREGLKWPANVLRATFASVLMAFNVPRDRWISWLN